MVTRVKVEVEIVCAFMASEKVAVSGVDTATSTALFNGETAITVGGVLSTGAGTVVKIQTKVDANGFPATSCTAVVIVAI